MTRRLAGVRRQLRRPCRTHVAVLGRRGATAAIARMAAAYERDTGHRPYVFAGSSPGALAFGSGTIVL